MFAHGGWIAHESSEAPSIGPLIPIADMLRHSLGGRGFRLVGTDD